MYVYLLSLRKFSSGLGTPVLFQRHTLTSIVFLTALRSERNRLVWPVEGHLQTTIALSVEGFFISTNMEIVMGTKKVYDTLSVPKDRADFITTTIRGIVNDWYDSPELERADTLFSEALHAVSPVGENEIFYVGYLIGYNVYKFRTPTSDAS